jgi:ABC-type multidrug transport system fused ATPase/permease subunit
MARKSTTIGEMTNLITTNAASFEHHNLMLLMNLLSTPLQIVLSTYFLWRYLGWATLAGLASMLAFIPINVYLTRTTKRLRVKKHALQDERIKLLNEVFIGIRMIKFMGWERSFEKLVNRIREKELRNLVKAALWRALSSLSWSLAPFMVTLVAFGTFILMNEENNLDPNSAFVCLTLFNMLRQPLNSIPRIIQGLIQVD